MRALVVSIWIFINLIFFGMCGYMYLLWSQYWMYIERQTETTTSTYDQQIYYYNRGYPPNESNKWPTTMINETKSRRIKHASKDNVTLIRNSKPRFPNLENVNFKFDAHQYNCPNELDKICQQKTKQFKDKLLKELHRVYMNEANVLKTGSENPYNVNYKGSRENYLEKPGKQLLCELKQIHLDTMIKLDVQKHFLKNYLPKHSFITKNYNNCAIVSNSGALHHSNLGEFIDTHDLVLRFNNAPIKGFEMDVGNKTTIRLINSQVISKLEYDFLHKNLYKNVTLLVWDPKNYTDTIDEWLTHPEYNFLINFMNYRNNSQIHLLNPQKIWEIWNFLQKNSVYRLRKNPPSSGFLGLTFLLSICDKINFFEYIPSVRVTKRCHYYDLIDNIACTFGVWHPLSFEKLLTLQMNVANDYMVYQNGYVTINGFNSINC